MAVLGSWDCRGGMARSLLGVPGGLSRALGLAVGVGRREGGGEWVGGL